MTSIRRRLTVMLLAGGLAIFAVAGLVLHVNVTHALEAQFDEGLTATAGALGGLLERDGETTEFDYTSARLPEFELGPRAQYFQLWYADGRDYTRSGSLGDAHSLPRRAGTPGAPQTFDLPLPDGRPGRAVGISVPVSDDMKPDEDPALQPRMTVVVAQSRAELDRRIAALDAGLAVAAAAALVLIAWGVHVAVKRGLAPLRELGQEVERIDPAHLSRRIETGGLAQELAPFAGKLNELFARLQAGFERQRRMTAAMAHELRTPIAELRSASDVARRWPDDDALIDELVASAGDVATRMSAAVEAVMRYCRLESGQAPREARPVALSALLDEQWAPRAVRAAERGVRFVNDVPESALVQSDGGLLAVLFGNLLDNAASFASPGTVRASVATEGESLTVHMANETDQLVAGDLAHLSEPFWRKDASRTDAAHSGLGLALVVSIAGVLGHRATFALHGSTFVVSVGGLPLHVGPGPAARRPAAPERITQP